MKTKTKKVKNENVEPIQSIPEVKTVVQEPVVEVLTQEDFKALVIPVDLIARVALMSIELLLKYINKRMENGAVRDKINQDAELYTAIKKGDGETIARIIKYRKDYNK